MKKVRKSEKQNVNGAGDVQYVSWKLSTAAWFYIMCCLKAKKCSRTLDFAVDNLTFRKKKVNGAAGTERHPPWEAYHRRRVTKVK